MYRHKPERLKLINKALELKAQGKTLSQITAEVGTSERTVAGWLHRAGFRKQDKYTAEQKDSMMEAYQRLNNSQLAAEETGFSVATIKYVALERGVKLSKRTYRKRTPEEAEALMSVSLGSEKVSKGHKQIADYINSLGFECVLNQRGLIKNSRGRDLELDIYVPEKRLAIEFHGLYFHTERFKAPKAHREKYKACKAAKIELVQVFEDEFADRPEVCLGYIASKLKRADTVFQARKLKLVAIDGKTAGSFWNDNHIQGDGFTQVNYGLFNETELVAAIGFNKYNNRNKPRQGQGEEWVLTRYALKPNASVTGGFQRLLKAFITRHSPKRIVTFSDNRWSNGAVYGRNGFQMDGDLKHDYQYVKKSNPIKRFHKSNFKKSEISRKFGLLSKNESESAAMARLGYERVWDAGKLRWVLKLG